MAAMPAELMPMSPMPTQALPEAAAAAAPDFNQALAAAAAQATQQAVCRSHEHDRCWLTFELQHLRSSEMCF